MWVWPRRRPGTGPDRRVLGTRRTCFGRRGDTPTMSVRDEFDAWAADGRDRGMEDRHWATAKHALGRMAVESGDVVLDLGCGSGYAGRAIRDTYDAGRVYGLDGSPEMARNAAG